MCRAVVNVPPRECTAPAMGECACPTHAADECIRRHEGCQDGDAAFWHITLDICFVNHRTGGHWIDTKSSVAQIDDIMRTIGLMIMMMIMITNVIIRPHR